MTDPNKPPLSPSQVRALGEATKMMNGPMRPLRESDLLHPPDRPVEISPEDEQTIAATHYALDDPERPQHPWCRAGCGRWPCHAHRLLQALRHARAELEAERMKRQATEVLFAEAGEAHEVLRGELEVERRRAEEAERQRGEVADKFIDATTAAFAARIIEQPHPTDGWRPAECAGATETWMQQHDAEIRRQERERCAWVVRQLHGDALAAAILKEP